MKAPYIRHIGRAKAKPDACPICGVSTTHALLVTSMLDALHAIYSHPNRVYKADVPGWFGYKTWYFECDHGSFLDHITFDENPFMKMIKKTEFEGKNYRVPLSYSR